jgi:Nif-specific regulatory protein
MIKIEAIQGSQQGSVWELDDDVVTIGRDPTNTLALDEVHVSSVHCRLARDDDRWTVRDLDSTNGTAVVRGTERHVLKKGEQTSMTLEPGDILLLGSAQQPVALGFNLTQPEGDEDARVVALARIQDLVNVEEQVQRDPDLLVRLFNVIRSLRWELDRAQVLSASRQAIFNLLPKATHLCISLIDPTTGDFQPMLATTRGCQQPQGSIHLSRTIVRRVLDDRAAVVLANAPEEVGETASIMGAGILSTMAAPLWKGDDILGVVQVDNRDSPGIFSVHDLNLLLVVASQVSLAIVNAELYEQLRVAERKLDGENRYLKTRARERQQAVVGSSAAMREVFAKVDKVKDTPVSVLVQGETGTGKEIVASAIHYRSARAERLFVAQNCAAMPENLLESELFGHKRGAFTGADRDKKGLFTVADGGTLFLDEVGEMPPSIQGKLLRVLQEGEIRPLGSNASVQVDVRLIAATNRNLDEEVAAGRFREDLYYRLNVFPITVPPLRERLEDIADLANHFLIRYGREFGKDVGGMSQDMLDALVSHDWPGNVRELENEIQRVVIGLEDGQIATADLLSPGIRRAERIVEQAAPRAGTLKERVEEVEKWIITRALEEHGNNKSQTARALGISREGLHKKLAKFGVR